MSSRGGTTLVSSLANITVKTPHTPDAKAIELPRRILVTSAFDFSAYESKLINIIPMNVIMVDLISFLSTCFPVSTL